ncbi:ATP/GTP-binding protein [Vampirovibrio sp.]|uniref:AAA family ATPase n=1 Tax=Vampirovibrio sp. TaxID=2717857 RepID=UPI003593F9DC
MKNPPILFKIPQPNHISAEPLEISLPPGQTLFLLGANGTGKSSLLFEFFRQLPEDEREGDKFKFLLGHRQQIFKENSDLNPATASSRSHEMKYYLQSDETRHFDYISAERPKIAIHNLLKLESHYAFSISNAVQSNDTGKTELLKKQLSPTVLISNILKSAGLTISLEAVDNETIQAHRKDGAPYNIAKLSDGERSALLLCAEVLVAREGSIIFIDEPERHLHKSINLPLMKELISQRPDCSFIISTHDINLPLSSPGSTTIALRSYQFAESQQSNWTAALIEPHTEVPEDIRADILGSREKILFIEGNTSSLDQPLYSILFLECTIIPKNSCNEVQQAIQGIRSTQANHWVKAWGIIDHDGRTIADIEKLKAKGLFPLPLYSIESVYFHPGIIDYIAQEQSETLKKPASEIASLAESKALEKAIHSKDTLIQNIVEKKTKEQILKQIPNKATLSKEKKIEFSINVPELFAEEEGAFKTIIGNKNWEELIKRYPVKATGAPNIIASTLGFSKVEHYQNKVIALLKRSKEARHFLLSLFPELIEAINQ